MQFQHRNKLVYPLCYHPIIIQIINAKISQLIVMAMLEKITQLTTLLIVFIFIDFYPLSFTSCRVSIITTLRIYTRRDL